MTPYRAIGLCEGYIDPETQNEILDAWQYLLDSGIIWSLGSQFDSLVNALVAEGFLNVKQ